MRIYTLAATIVSAGCVAACATAPMRPLVPPITGVQPAALYSSPERPNADRPAPVSLRIMCHVPREIARSIVYEPEQTTGEINLLSDASYGVNFSGIKASYISAELQGSVSDYYELKLVNVRKQSVSEDQGRAIFARFLALKTCGPSYVDARKSRAVYQVLAIYTGDVQFGVKTNALLSADLTAKLKALEPSAKLKLSRTFNMSFSGTQVVGAVELISR